MENIIYRLNGEKRPKFDLNDRIIQFFNKIPIFRDIVFIRNIIFKSYKLDLSTHISKNFYLSAPYLNVGRNVGLSDTFIVAYAPVIIGDNCSFSFRNVILTSTHDLTEFSTVIAKPVIIGDNVWVTTNVTILPGITIGNNTVIGAGSVVTTDIPSNVFAAGNPCRVIKSINFKK